MRTKAGRRSSIGTLVPLTNTFPISSVSNLNPLPNSNAPPIENSIYQVMKEASLLFCLPENPFFLPKALGSHAVQVPVYAYCGWVFAHHFCNRL